VGGHVKTMADQIAAQIDAMGKAVRGAGDTYEVTDGDLANSFKGIF